jgi:hypothetical protein
VGVVVESLDAVVPADHGQAALVAGPCVPRAEAAADPGDKRAGVGLHDAPRMGVAASTSTIAAPAPARHVQAQREGHPIRVGRWVAGVIGVSAVAFLAVVTTPGLVNGVAYVTKSAPVETFIGQSYDTSCHKGGCQTNTVGVLVNGTTRTKASLPCG